MEEDLAVWHEYLGGGVFLLLFAVVLLLARGVYRDVMEIKHWDEDDRK